MTREKFIEVQTRLEMTIPQIADYLGVAENTVRSWRITTKNRRNIPGPVEKCLKMEFEKRGIPWIL